MKISASVAKAWKACTASLAGTLKFLLTEGCLTLLCLAPLLFLTADGWMKWLALLSVPMFIGLMLWARVNAAGAMRDSLNGGSLFSMTLADTTAYGKKIAYGMKRLVMLLLWATNEKIRSEAGEAKPAPYDAILANVCRLLLPCVLVFGLCVLFNGHVSPGGGFSGGSVLGAALILFAVVLTITAINLSLSNSGKN